MCTIERKSAFYWLSYKMLQINLLSPPTQTRLESKHKLNYYENKWRRISVIESQYYSKYVAYNEYCQNTRLFMNASHE